MGTTTGNASLAVFDGLSPNGQWSLYAHDDAANDFTTINGWSLELTWSDIASPTGLVNIAGGQATVGSPNVTLTINATDPAPASGVTQMRFSNNGTSFSAYQPYATSAAWTLTSGSGNKTVYAQFKDADGNESAVVSDTVKLDATGPKAKKLTPKKNAKGVSVTTKVKIKASESLTKSSVTKKTVFLKQKGVSGKVKAKVKYKASEEDDRAHARERPEGRQDLPGDRQGRHGRVRPQVGREAQQVGCAALEVLLHDCLTQRRQPPAPVATRPPGRSRPLPLGSGP